MFIELFTRTLIGLAPLKGATPPKQQPQIVQLVVATPGVGAPITADAAVDKVQKFYSDIKMVTALFRQTVTNSTFGTNKTSDGQVLIMKPGKMRWDYKEKKGNVVNTKKSFISNGTNLYVVEHDNLQVLKKNLQQDLMPVAVTFLYGKGDLKTEFTPSIEANSKYGDKGDLVLKLIPKKPSAQYKTLYLVVNPTDFHVKQSVIIDSSNNTNNFRFFAPDFAKAIDAKLFEFDEKSLKNYRIVDADAPKPAAGSAAGSGSATAPKTK